MYVQYTSCVHGVDDIYFQNCIERRLSDVFKDEISQERKMLAVY